MPRFLITAPDGTKYQLDGPDGSTADDALKIVQAQHPAAPNPAANMPAMDPSAGGSTLNVAGFDTGIKTPEWLDRGLAGAGQAMTNVVRGASQFLPGGATRADIAESRKLDAPLDSTTAGKVGNFAGNVAMMAPTLVVPGATGGFLAATRASAGVGAGLGALQPSTSTGETLRNAAIGGVAGGVAPAIGQGIQAVYQGGKALAEPFVRGGVDRIAGRTLNTFAGSPQAAQDAVAALQSAKPVVPGVQPTAGMVVGNGGIAQLQRTLANNPDLTTAFTARNQGNTNALLDALGGIAGNDSTMAAAQAARSAAADPLYAAAKAQTIVPDASLTNLLQRPVMQTAMGRAQTLAANKGESIATDQGLTVNGLHYMKLALDDMASNPAVSGIGKNELSAITSSKNALLDAIDAASPEYAQARQAFAQGSQPINSMQVGQSLLDKLSPALNDFSTNKVLRPSSFADALAAGDRTAQKATGFPGAKMDQVLSPQDMQTVQGVGQTLGQIRDAQTMGKAIGSNTAQNLTSQNVLRQIAGPLGLPESFVENQLMQSLMRPVQFAGKMAEPKITARLGQAALDPQDAAVLMRQALGQTTDPRLRNYLARALLLGGRTEATSLGQ